MILLDTHLVIWLYAGEVSRIPPLVQQRLEREDLGISPVVRLELQLLHETGRINLLPAEILDDLRQRIGLVTVDVSLSAVVEAAVAISWTRDPFDRLIVGQAMACGLSLITADRSIRQQFKQAVWG